LLLVGRLHRAVGEIEAARAAWCEALDIRTRRFGADDARTLEVADWLGTL
jgi:hypothetical protein